MLKEIVTSIFCCLPHHHEAPVVAERITPITIVSQEPYSSETFCHALAENRLNHAISLCARFIVDGIGRKDWDTLEELCEQFAQEGRYLASGIYDEYKYDDDPVQKGKTLLQDKRIGFSGLIETLSREAVRSYNKGFAIKGLYFSLVRNYEHCLVGSLYLISRDGL